MRTTPRPCRSCGDLRLLPYRIGGEDVCADCAGQPRPFACAVCGSDSEPLPGPRCANCLHTARVDRLLTGPDGCSDPRFTSLRDYLVGSCTRPETTRRWLSQSASARIIKSMVAGELDISLEALARLPQTPATGYTAALLQTAGVLPSVNFERIRLEAWQADAFIQMTDPAARRIAKQYASWILNPRFTEPGTRATVDEWQRHHGSKQTLVAVIDLLGTISTCGHSLATWPQHELDRHLAEGTISVRVVGFLSWARTQRLTTLTITPTPTRTRQPAIADDRRWEAARRLLHDETIGSSMRLIGLLTVVYGIPVTRIVSLTRDRVRDTADSVTISFGADPLTLPTPIASLVRTHLAGIGSPYANARWLFPGRRPGDHLTARTARNRLAKADIEVRATQTSAMLDMARHASRSVLADLLGISIRYASRVATDANRDWSSYPALRSRQTAEKP
jgi:hypothetical protein